MLDRTRPALAGALLSIVYEVPWIIAIYLHSAIVHVFDAASVDMSLLAHWNPLRKCGRSTSLKYLKSHRPKFWKKMCCP